ncbi:RNA polymerase sigma factor [Marilutibacter alkalisoli]|uniref:Sigma-70 family RNA polymerase sigma factor n=1 Tax=Marilutibacter alkalisoli TaxID=2591633 RepID=A0A514BUC1_9GAMM|nr:sigma-70 family RNA polymerase sigma factor [Lysobacter alkalisoli]QDH70629.1 sigma-70 family RNA polymerase sigma factor [Lysobacter alkalisoli]
MPAQAPQDDGFEAFLRDQRPLLVGYLCRRLPEEDAKDIAQEAMIRLMRYRDLPQEQLRRLVYRIAANVLLDRGRRISSSGSGAQVSLDDGYDWLQSPEPSHEQRIDQQQQLVHVRQLILQLPERCREVYLLNRIEGMSYTQIAERLGISVKAVEKHVSRALKGLRQGMEMIEGSASRESRP